MTIINTMTHFRPNVEQADSQWFRGRADYVIDFGPVRLFAPTIGEPTYMVSTNSRDVECKDFVEAMTLIDELMCIYSLITE